MSWVIIWLVLVITTGIIADRKGRSVIGWLALAVLVAPITILILLALPSVKPPPALPVLEANDIPATKLCPECAEPVRVAAKVCRHCGYRFNPA